MMIETAKENIEEALASKGPRTKYRLIGILREVAQTLGTEAGNQLIRTYRLEKKFKIKPVAL